MKKNLGSILVGGFMVIASLYGIISGEIAGIGSHNSPLRIINSVDDFYEFWFINLMLLYFGGLIVKRAIWGMPNKDKKKG